MLKAREGYFYCCPGFNTGQWTAFAVEVEAHQKPSNDRMGCLHEVGGGGYDKSCQGFGQSVDSLHWPEAN